jgi:hypothetical protein
MQAYRLDNLSLDLDRYEMSNCLFEATLQQIEKECSCTPKYFVDIVEGFDPCEGTQKQCMYLLMAEMGDQGSILQSYISAESYFWIIFILKFCTYFHPKKQIKTYLSIMDSGLWVIMDFKVFGSHRYT